MSDVLDLLGVTNPVARSAHAHFLRETVRSFSFNREVTKRHPTLHARVATMGQFKSQLNHVVEAMKGMNPESRVMMSSAEPPFLPRDWDDLLDRIESLVLTLGELDGSGEGPNAKLAKKLPDTQLDQVVAFLMLRIRDITGELAHARATDSRYTRPARLASREGDAIWMLLKHLPGITESGIANRIVTLKRRGVHELENKFSDYRFVGGWSNFHIEND